MPVYNEFGGGPRKDAITSLGKAYLDGMENPDILALSGEARVASRERQPDHEGIFGVVPITYRCTAWAKMGDPTVRDYSVWIEGIEIPNGNKFVLPEDLRIELHLEYWATDPEGDWEFLFPVPIGVVGPKGTVTILPGYTPEATT